MEGSPNMLFVGGCGRSGTTLLQKLLLRHPAIIGGPELGLTLPITEVYRQALTSSKLGHLDNYLSREDLDSSFKSFYLSLFKNLDFTRAQYISEKTPSNLFAMDSLSLLFPQAKFICVYRDGRAVLNSHLHVRERYRKAKKYRGGLSPKTVTNLWKNSIKSQILLKDLVSPRRFYTVRYEELISNPDNVLFELLEFLDIDTETDLLSKEEKTQSSIEKIAHVNNIWYTSEAIEKDIDVSRMNSWKNQLSPILKLYTGITMSKELSILGYKNSWFSNSIGGLYAKLNFRNFVERSRNSNIWKLYIRIRFGSK
jgi:protein-tyrosine sulfotransferase